jgi:hypothetical protein
VFQLGDALTVIYQSTLAFKECKYFIRIAHARMLPLVYVIYMTTLSQIFHATRR